jgi:hypothetical protein
MTTSPYSPLTRLIRGEKSTTQLTAQVLAAPKQSNPAPWKAASQVSQATSYPQSKEIKRVNPQTQNIDSNTLKILATLCYSFHQMS